MCLFIPIVTEVGSAVSSEPPGRRLRGLRSLRKPAKKRPAGPPPATTPVDSGTPAPPAEAGDSIIHAALYRDGRRVSTHDTLADTFQQQRAAAGTLAWIGLHRPTPAELVTLASEFDLHPLALEDALEAHQRPKLERYGGTLFVVLRAARYLDDAEEVDFGELHVFVGRDFVITVRHGGAPDLSAVRHRMEDTPNSSSAAPKRSSTRSSMPSSTAMRRSSTGSRTTSTRSRPRSSAATPASPAGSMNSPARWSNSSAPPARSTACWRT